MYQQVEGHVDVFRRIYTDFYYDNYRVVIRVQDKSFLLSNFLKFRDGQNLPLGIYSMNSDRIGVREIGSEGEGWEN